MKQPQRQVTLYVEGGGDNDALKTECRRGFRLLLERLGLKGRMPKVIACGSRRNAYEQFCGAVASNARADIAVLLVDAEAPVATDSAWEHVKERRGDGWAKPSDTSDDQLHLMVVCMESWFLADRVALATFYGQGFVPAALPANPKIEEIAKHDVFDGLSRATRQTKTKGEYGKGAHSFKLLAELDPGKIARASPWAERFFVTLNKLST